MFYKQLNLFLVLLLSNVLLVIASATERDSPRLFEDTMCLGVKFSQGQPLHDLEMLKELGVKWVREEIAWSAIEPRKGVYKPLPESLKTRLNFYRANDIGVIFIMAYENGVAYPNKPDAPHDFVNPVAFGRYSAYMARQLKASGVRFVVELWNEPHNSTFAKKVHLGGNWQGAPPSPWVDHYVKMVAEAVKRVKALDASIPVITNDDMWVVHYHFLEKGLPKELDGFAVHPYTGGGPPEHTAVKYDTDWTRPYQVVDQDQSFESAVRRLKEQGVKKMGKTPQVWVTEWGWRVGERSPSGAMSESKIALYLPRAFILAANANVDGMCWFSSMDGPDGPMGLKTNDGRKRPAYDAFVKMSQMLARTTFTCELNQELNSTKRAFAFKNTDSGDWVIASWDTNGKSFYDESVEYSKQSSSEDPSCKIKEN